MSTRHVQRRRSAPCDDQVPALQLEAQAHLAADRLDDATLAFGALAWQAPWCLEAWRGLAAALQRRQCEPAASLTAALAQLMAAPSAPTDGAVPFTTVEASR